MQPQAADLHVQLATDWNLGIGDTSVAPLTPETRIARRFTGLHAAEEHLEGEVYAHGDILQNLRLDLSQRRMSRFKGRQPRLLVVEAHRLLALLTCITTFGQ